MSKGSCADQGFDVTGARPIEQLMMIHSVQALQRRASYAIPQDMHRSRIQSKIEWCCSVREEAIVPDLRRIRRPNLVVMK